MEAALRKRAADLLTACVKLRAVVRVYREMGLPAGPLGASFDALVAEVDRVLDGTTGDGDGNTEKGVPDGRLSDVRKSRHVRLRPTA